VWFRGLGRVGAGEACRPLQNDLLELGKWLVRR
jgi:hypothetical protein